MKKIIIPIDFSEHSEFALETERKNLSQEYIALELELAKKPILI